MTFDEVINHTIGEMYKEKHSKIPEILRPIYIKTISDNEEYHKNKDRIIEIMTNKGLIERVNSDYHQLTDFGKSIHEDGGWLLYLTDRLREKQMQEELISSSIRTNNLQKTLLWATVLFTFLTLIISTADFLAHNEEEAIQLKMFQLQKAESQDRQQSKKTTDPALDSSTISTADSSKVKIN